MRQSDQNACGKPRVEVGTLHAPPVHLKMHASANAGDALKPKRIELSGQCLFESDRAGSKRLECLGVPDPWFCSLAA